MIVEIILLWILIGGGGFIIINNLICGDTLTTSDLNILLIFVFFGPITYPILAIILLLDLIWKLYKMLLSKFKINWKKDELGNIILLPAFRKNKS